MLDSILTLDIQQQFDLITVIIITLSSLGLGVLVALSYMYKNDYNKNFVLTLVLLPAVVQAVIMLVNGNLGTGVAVMGAFSLVRFRSIPGTARDINSIFFAMSIGIATGMGYLGFAAVFLFLVASFNMVLTQSSFGERKTTAKELKITIPEDLDYTGVFDDIFEEFTSKVQLNRVRTTNLGSMYKLQYSVTMKDPAREKAMIDALRCRNGNLDISLGKASTAPSEIL